MGRLGILVPDDHELRAIADLAERGACWSRAAGRPARPATAAPAQPVATIAPSRSASVTAARASSIVGAREPVHERTPGVAQQLPPRGRARSSGRPGRPPRSRPARRARRARRRVAETTSDRRARRPRARTAPRGPSVVTSSHSSAQPAQISDSGTGGRGRLGQRGEQGGSPRRQRGPGRRSRRTACRPASRGGSLRQRWGMSRTSPAGHQSGSGARRSRSANSTSFTFAHLGGAGAPDVSRLTPRAPRTCAANAPASNSSSDAVGRGLTSSTHSSRPSQIPSTPNAPRTREPRRDLGADRAQPSVELGQLGRGQPRRRDVPRPLVAPAVQLLGEAEHHRVAAVGDRDRRTGQAGHMPLQDLVGAQPAAGPATDASPATAGPRLSQPTVSRAAGADGPSVSQARALRPRQPRRATAHGSRTAGSRWAGVPSSSRPSASRATSSGRFSSPAP